MPTDPEQRLATVANALKEKERDLYAYVRSRLKAVVPAGEIDDVVADILGDTAVTVCEKVLSAPDKVPLYDDELIPWAKTIALYKIMNQLRRRSRQKRALSIFGPSLHDQYIVDAMLDEHPEPSVPINDVLRDLVESDRRLLADYYLKRIPTQQTARELGLSMTAARKRRARLLKRLRNRLIGGPE